MRIAVGIPDQRGVLSFSACSALLQLNGYVTNYIWLQGSAYVGKARNTLVRDYLQTGADKLLFIDTDLAFGPDQVRRITSHDVDIAAGLYPAKSEKGHAFCWPQQKGLTGLQEVERIATGFMCIQRGVFDKIREHHGDRTYYDASVKMECYDYFPAGLEFGGLDPEGRRVWMTEDYAFCEMARAAGCKVFADYDVRVGHLGACEFKVAENEKKEN
jgi:hypothetical protein